MGDSNSDLKTFVACPQSTPLVAGVALHQLIGDADANDRANQRVRAGRRQPEPPRAQVPDDGGDEQREDHGESGAAADLQDQLDRQQRDDAEGYRAGRSSTPRKFQKPDQTTAMWGSSE